MAWAAAVPADAPQGAPFGRFKTLGVKRRTGKFGRFCFSVREAGPSLEAFALHRSLTSGPPIPGVRNRCLRAATVVFASPCMSVRKKNNMIMTDKDLVCLVRL